MSSISLCVLDIREAAARALREYGDDESAGPSSYEEAAELFTRVFGRKPDRSDGDAGDLWSHVCAAAE